MNASIRTGGLAIEFGLRFSRLSSAWRPAAYFQRFKSSSARAVKKNHKADRGADPSHEFDMDKWDSKMQLVVDRLREELKSIRVGRANPAILDGVVVQIKEARLPISELAQVFIRDNQTLQVVASDEKTLAAVEKAVRNSNLNLNPQRNGDRLNIPVPRMTHEGREKLGRDIHTMGEHAKTKIRVCRQDAKKDLKKSGISDKEELKSCESEIQAAVDRYNADVDRICAEKRKTIQN